ncbi:MAG TPA: hypothetical protein VHO06_09240 [Polyangia bacterium]|nr:hypothetical protein [Polyangia bacterium]
MLAALVVASLLAQAEPAPPEPGAPVVAAPTPPPPTPDNTFAVYAGWGRRLGSEASTIGPANGFSVGGLYQRRYLTLAGGFELGGALDFFYDKFETDVTGSAMDDNGNEQTFPAQRTISQTSFTLLQTAAWRRGRVRPFLGAGPGFTIAYFSTPELLYRPGSFDAVQPLLRGAGGLDVQITHDVIVSVRAGYTLVLTHPTYTPATVSYSFLGDLFDADLGVAFQF